MRQSLVRLTCFTFFDFPRENMISDETQQEFIRNLPSIITAFAAIIAALFSGVNLLRSAKNGRKLESNASQSQINSDSLARKIGNVEKLVNGQTDKLVAVTAENEFAKGQQHEREKIEKEKE